MGSGRTTDQDRGGYGAGEDSNTSFKTRGGAQDFDTRGDDYGSSGRTGGGLGADDTYGDSTRVSYRLSLLQSEDRF